MEYSLGKWLERVETKLNAVLQLNGINPDTLGPLEPLDQTPPETGEPEEEVDTREPQAQSQEELKAKADQLQKSMNKQGSKSRWQG